MLSNFKEIKLTKIKSVNDIPNNIMDQFKKIYGKRKIEYILDDSISEKTVTRMLSDEDISYYFNIDINNYNLIVRKITMVKAQEKI